MRIGIDISPIEDSPAGIGHYTSSLISALLDLDNANQYYLYSTKPVSFESAKSVVISRDSRLPGKGLRWMKAVAKHAKKNRLSVFVSPSNHTFARLFTPTLQYIHDLAPVLHPKYFPKLSAIKYRLTLSTVMNKSDSILTISASVKQEIKQYYPDQRKNIYVLYPGLNSWLYRKSSNRELESKLPMEFLLTVSTLEPRKNHLNMIRGFAEYKANNPDSNLKFVIVGKKGWYYQEIFTLVKDLHLEEQILFMGYVADNDLAIIMQKAKAFIYLSFYEGFGMPPTEALSLGIPTLVSDIPVFRETLANYALYTNHKDPAKIAQDIEKVLNAAPIIETKQQELRQLYSWKQTAKKLLEIIHETKSKTSD